MKRNSLIVLRCLLLMLIIMLSACASEETPPAPTEAPAPTQVAEEATPSTTSKILAFGDSVTEGLGVEPEEAYPALLQNRLRAEGYEYEVINGGISGETSSAALSRVEWMLTQKPDIVIVETGANDALRGIDLELTQNNISQIVKRFKESNVVVVLAGMQIIQNLGEEYTTQFANIYPAVAKEHDVILIPFFLEGVAGRPHLNQADVIHPTPEGYKIVLETIYPYVLEGIEAHRAK